MEIPEAWVISLPEDSRRTDRLVEHFREKQFRNYRFFAGIHGRKFGLRTIWHYDVDNPGEGFMIDGKPIGIWLSHYMVWNALHMNDAKHVLILEDDVVLPDTWEQQVTSALENTPENFDMLYLGACCTEHHQMNHVNGRVYEMNPGPQCLHAYIVARKAVATLLGTQRKVYAPIDASLCFHSHSFLKVYVALPEIVKQLDTVYPP